jgi:hypothetical protein
MGLVWAASFVLFVPVYLFVISPRSQVKALLVKESAEKKQMYEASLNAATEESKKKLADEIESLKSKLSDYAVEFEESANLTFDISRIAADKQVSSFTIKATDQAGDSGQLGSENLQENHIAISFESNFRRFAAFLNAIERHRPVIFVDRFRMLRGEQGVASHKVDMDLSIFVRKRPEG